MAKGKKHNRKNSDFRVIELRMKIARAYVEGNTQEEIAKKMDMSIASVSKHLSAIRIYWLAIMAADFDQVKSEQLAKIDRLERTAWRAWRRSTRPIATRHVQVERNRAVEYKRNEKGEVDKTKAPTVKMVVSKEIDDTTERTNAGDPRFLQIVDNCIERRLKLMGLLDERNTTNVYVDFGSLLQQKREEIATKPQGDVIENLIASVGLEHKEQTNGEPLAESNGSTSEGHST